jgi:competence protein ComEC
MVNKPAAAGVAWLARNAQMTTHLDLAAAEPVSPRERARQLLAGLADCFLAERERWPLWLPVLMGTGIGAYFWLSREPPFWLGPGLVLMAAAATVAAWRRQRALALPLALGALALGFAAAQVEARLVAAPVLARRLGPVVVEGRLVALDPLPEGARLVIAPTHIDRLAAAAMPAQVRVRLRHGDAAALPGSWLRLKAVLMPPPAPAMPGAYDFERRAWFDRLGAVGYALGAPAFIAPPDGAGVAGWRVQLQAVRAGVTARIRAALPGESGAIAAALIAGDTHAIRPADADAFRNAGLAHILVIAGLHMGMVAGIVFFAVRALMALIPRVALYHATKKHAAVAALVATFCYMLLSGATVSSRRAFVMIGLALLAVLVDRLSVSARAVAFAAAFIMMMTPESATGPSFQMSFAAVAALIACYEALRPVIARWHAHAGGLRRAGLYLFGITVTTIVTTLATMPFTIYHFNRFALYSVVANAIVVPITGFWVMPCALLACLAMPLHLEALALVPMSWGIAAITAVARMVTSWPGAVLDVPSMPAVALALASVGGIWLCIWLGRWRWLGLVPIAAGYLAIVFARPPDLLVAADAHVVAVRAPDGAYLPSIARIAEESWTRRAAASFGKPWPQDGSAGAGALRCDAEACLYRARGRVVALIRDGTALSEECGSADLVVSPVAAHRACRHTRIIDRNDTWRKGGYAVWLDPDRIRVETVRDWQGERPWVPQPKSAFDPRP